MKRLIFTIAFCGLLAPAFAQTKTDSATTQTDTSKTKKHGYKLLIGFKTKTLADTVKPKVIKPVSNFNFGVTFSRVEIGFSRLLDNGSFTLSSKNQFLDYKGFETSYVGFDVLQMRYRFNPYFKMYLAAGFDWTLIRLQQNITIQQNAPALSYTTDNVSYSKNRFSSSYLRIPLAFDFTSKQDKRGSKYQFTIGPEIGFLLNGKVKQISQEMGKKKFYDNYHFSKFRYGGYVRAGYGREGIFVKYYASDMFENSPAQAGLKSLNFGITVNL